MIAEPLPIGVVRNPISASEPCFDCPLQSSKGLVFLTKDCEDTARVVEGLPIFSFVSPRFSSQTILLRQEERLASVLRLSDPKCLILLQCNRAMCRLAKR